MQPVYDRGRSCWHDPDSLNLQTRLISRRRAKLTRLRYLHLAIAFGIPAYASSLGPLSHWMQWIVSVAFLLFVAFYARCLDEERRLHERHLDVISGFLKPPP
jgi:hypothetical protein